MKKLMVGVSLGLASMSQAQAWTGGIEDMRTMQANESGQVVRVKSSRVECCRTRPGRSHGHQHEVKRIHQGTTYYCADATAMHQGHQQVRHAQPARRVVNNQHRQHQLQQERARRQAMYAAQARAKAQKLAELRKRAAMLEQQKRLANQKRRQAMIAQQKAQQQRRAQLLAQQRRAQLLAQQQRRQAQVVAARTNNCAQPKRHVVAVKPRPPVVHRPAPVQEMVIERYIVPTYVKHTAPAPVYHQPAPRQRLWAQQTIASQQMVGNSWRNSSSVGMVQQSVEKHDRMKRTQHTAQHNGYVQAPPNGACGWQRNANVHNSAICRMTQG